MCVLVEHHERNGGTFAVRNACHSLAAGPDSPMCGACLDSGHDKLPNLIPIRQVIEERAEQS